MNKLRRMKNELKAMRKEDNPCIPPDDIMELCNYLSEEAKKDILDNGYDPRTGELIYSKLKTETLIEIVDPVLIVGSGDGTRVFIDDVSDWRRLLYE